MGLGRITRFAPTPADSRRVNVMHAGRAGVKALAPPDDLFADFSREKSEAKRAGASAEAAHAAAFRRTRYRARFRRHIVSSADSREALRALVEEAKARDVYLMCMCPYRTPGEACHTYLLLALAREMEVQEQELHHVLAEHAALDDADRRDPEALVPDRARLAAGAVGVVGDVGDEADQRVVVEHG